MEIKHVSAALCLPILKKILRKKSELQDRLYLHIKERVSHIYFLSSVYILQLLFLFTQQNLKQLKRSFLILKSIIRHKFRILALFSLNSEFVFLFMPENKRN